jgi:hypothetical protein
VHDLRSRTDRLLWRHAPLIRRTVGADGHLSVNRGDPVRIDRIVLPGEEVGAVFVILSGVGCGGRAGPKVEYVEGLVTLDGSPVAGASVGYSPVDRSVGLPASGKTDAQGRYRLTAVRGGREGAGTAVGDYAVSITKLEIVPANEPQPPPPAWWNPSLGPTPTPVRSLIPQAYGESATSGLRVSVKPGRNTGPDVSFQLRADYNADVQ